MRLKRVVALLGVVEIARNFLFHPQTPSGCDSSPENVVSGVPSERATGRTVSVARGARCTRSTADEALPMRSHEACSFSGIRRTVIDAMAVTGWPPVDLSMVHRLPSARRRGAVGGLNFALQGKRYRKAKGRFGVKKSSVGP